MGSLGFRWSYADNFGVLARGADDTDVHFARLIAGVKRAGLDVHDISLAFGGVDVLGCEVSRQTRLAVERLVCTYSLSRADCIFASSHKRASDEARFLALSNCGALSILDATFNFVRASHLVAGEPWSTVRMEQRALG